MTRVFHAFSVGSPADRIEIPVFPRPFMTSINPPRRPNDSMQQPAGLMPLWRRRIYISRDSRDSRRLRVSAGFIRDERMFDRVVNSERQRDR